MWCAASEQEAQLTASGQVLQAVHSGADLQASAKAAASAMPQGAKDHLGYVLGHQGDHEVLPLMQNAVEARTEIAQSGQFAGNRWGHSFHKRLSDFGHNTWRKCHKIL